MKNRAKCNLCKSIIESFHRHDYVSCKCGEISIDGGDEYYKCRANDFKNFLRVDDEGNEIIVIFKSNQEKEENKNDEVKRGSKPSKKELLDMLEIMIKSYENLPAHAMITPITNYDFLSALLLLLAVFKSDCTEDI